VIQIYDNIEKPVFPDWVHQIENDLFDN